MSGLMLVNLFATVCGVVVFVRAVNVIRHMDRRAWGGHYLTWFAFGISYATLACASAGAVIALWEGSFAIAQVFWLGASAGLIVFDRRRGRRAPVPKPAPADPDATVPMGVQR